MDRMIYRDDIKSKAATFLGLSLKYVRARRLLREELEKVDRNETKIKQKREVLRAIIYQRLTYKKNLKGLVQ
jgi:hypothetical protein